MKVYLDNAATTPIAKEVVKEIEPYLYDYFGNPSSTHSFGRKTKNAIEINRKKIADLIHAKNNEIFEGNHPPCIWDFLAALAALYLPLVRITFRNQLITFRNQ